MSSEKIDISDLPFELYDEIFSCFEDDLRSLYSYLQVNRSWCRRVVKYIWRFPFPDDYNRRRCDIQVLFPLFNNEEISILTDVGINLPTSQEPLFNYASYVKEINIIGMAFGAKKWISTQTSVKLDMDTVSTMVMALSTLLLRNTSKIKSLTLFEQFGFRDFLDSMILNDAPSRFKFVNQLTICLKYNSFNTLIDEKLNLLPDLSKNCTNIKHLTVSNFNKNDYKRFDYVISFLRSQKEISICRFYRLEFDFTSTFKSLILPLFNSLRVLVLHNLSRQFRLGFLYLFPNLEALVIRAEFYLPVEDSEDWKKFMQAPSNIKSLNLAGLPEEITVDLIKKSNAKLKWLTMESMPTEVLETAICFCKNITHLTLRYMKMDILKIPKMLNSLHHLSNFTIDPWDHDATGFVEELSKLELKHLRYLDLVLHIRPETFKVFLKNVKFPLEVLIMKGYKFLDGHVEMLMEYVDRQKVDQRFRWLGLVTMRPKEDWKNKFLMEKVEMAKGKFGVLPAEKARISEGWEIKSLF
ncbi:9818_t:CDS:1 [Acaulospora colombiana]|uniref:9818_t:CDS:1 n=1 Tax=Acaulospora colombiana TaxID=27376 RepID=A0ACA9M203_9GLOM|nr:9818_t:CDS:1 [Acaulospora colombiana]